jgi:hypothetical protein
MNPRFILFDRSMLQSNSPHIILTCPFLSPLSHSYVPHMLLKIARRALTTRICRYKSLASTPDAAPRARTRATIWTVHDYDVIHPTTTFSHGRLLKYVS